MAVPWALPRQFDLAAFSTGANVYFADQPRRVVVDHAESVDGGLTTVVVAKVDGRPVRTLLTNGKFQGNDSSELRAQIGFAVAPLLHTSRRDSALVIGWGTGVTTRVLSDAGFERVDVVELSQDIIDVAQRNFAGVHGDVLSRAGTHLYVTDGRSFLALSSNQYDLITVELTSIWFAGAAALYNREFYQLAKARLRNGGVLQQWVQLHHLYATDLGAVVGSLYSEFPQIWIYGYSEQGTMVACAADCSDLTASRELEASAGMDFARAHLGGSLQLGATTILSPPRTEAFLNLVGGPSWRDALVSTDDNGLLEYNTPAGNVRSWESLAENLAVFAAAERGASPR